MMRSRWYLFGMLIVAVLLALTGCEALDGLGEGVATPGAETPGVETPAAETPGVETPGIELTPTEAPAPEVEATLTQEVTPGAEVTPTGEVTPGMQVTPTEALTPGAEATPTGEATPSLEMTPTEERTPGGEMTPTEGATPGVEATPTETQEPGAGITPTETVTPEVTAPEGAPETLVLADLDGLEAFDSYRTRTVITWTPESGAATLIEALVEANVQEGLLDIGTEVVQHTVITLTQGEQPTQTLEFVSAGDDVWTRTDSLWTMVSVNPTDLLDQVGWVGDPDVLVSADAAGEFVGLETVEGVQLWRYRFPYDQISQEQRFADFEDAQLDVWVTPDLVVARRLELTAVGTGPEGRTGDLMLVSRVTNVNEPVEFPLPPELEERMAQAPDGLPQAGAEAAPDVLTRNDILLIEGASNVRTFGNVVIFDADRAPAAVIDYYAGQAAGLDWDIAEPQAETSAELTADGTAVNIVAVPTEQEGRSTVVLAVNEG